MAINVVTAGSGLTGGGSGSTVILSVADGGIVNSMLAADSVLDSNIASGQVVKTFNGLTDSVTLAAGLNVILTPVGNTITVSSPTIIDVDLPLVLTTPDYGATINGSITITPAHDGGAVALQTGSPVTQTGFAALDAVYLPYTGKVYFGETSGDAFINIKNDGTNSVDYLKFVDADDLDIFSVSKLGDVAFGNNAFTFVEATPLASFNVPLTLNDTVTVSKTLLGTTTSLPVVDLVSHSATVPLFQSTSDIANSLVLKSVDENTVVNTTLYSDGKFFTRQVKADSFVVGTAAQEAGAVTLGFTGASFFACDAAGAPITFTLPLLVSGSPSGYQYAFKKIDVSTNQVMVSAQGGQSIDGATDKIITTRWGSLKVVSVVSGSSGYWLTL